MQAAWRWKPATSSNEPSSVGLTVSGLIRPRSAIDAAKSFDVLEVEIADVAGGDNRRQGHELLLDVLGENGGGD